METIVANLLLGYRLFEAMNYQANQGLMDEMSAVAFSSYNRTNSLLEREFKHNHFVYFIRNNEQELVAFFLTNFDEINNELISYMGLLAVETRYKNSFLAAPLMFHHFRRLKEKEFLIGRPIQAWATTASPTILKIFCSFCHHEPGPDGSYTEEGEAIARKIGHYYNLPSDPENPFVARGLAHDTQYSKEENLRMERVARHKSVNVFEQFGIDEKLGDRLIVVVRSLDIQKFIRWSQRFKMAPGYWQHTFDVPLYQDR